MDSILADEPSVHSLPDSDEGEASRTEGSDTGASRDEGETPEPRQAKDAPSPAATAGDDDDSEDGTAPTDLEGFKKALAAARGDKRKARKKWQETEQRYAEIVGEVKALRAQMQRPQTQAPPAAEEKKPGFWESEPEQFIDGRLQTFEQRQQERFIETERRVMRRTVPDYPEAEQAFIKAAQSNPDLVERFRRAPDPVGYAYETGKQLMAIDKYGATTLDELKEKVRAEVMAEMNADRSEQRTATAKPIPKSIASARGSGAGVKPAWSGPRSIDDILA
jgi:hypothetical protein